MTVSCDGCALPITGARSKAESAVAKARFTRVGLLVGFRFAGVVTVATVSRCCGSIDLSPGAVDSAGIGFGNTIGLT